MSVNDPAAAYLARTNKSAGRGKYFRQPWRRLLSAASSTPAMQDYKHSEVLLTMGRTCRHAALYGSSIFHYDRIQTSLREGRAVDKLDRHLAQEAAGCCTSWATEQYMAGICQAFLLSVIGMRWRNDSPGSLTTAFFLADCALYHVEADPLCVLIPLFLKVPVAPSLF